MGYVAFVDISENQGHVDFARMYAQGVRYLIPRAGINGRYDAMLVEYVAEARAAGIVVVALYWFINPCSSASPETQGHLLAAACLKYGVPTAMLDCEWYDREGGPNPLLSPASYVSWLNRMRAVVEHELGNRPIVYTSASFWDVDVRGKGAGGADDFADCDLICPDYPGSRKSGDPIPVGVPPDGWAAAALHWKTGPHPPAAWDTWDAWQFSAGYNRQGPVYGCTSGDLDLNVAKPGVIDRWLGAQPVPSLPDGIPGPVPLPQFVWPANQEDDEMFVVHVPTVDGQPCGARLAGPIYKTPNGNTVAGPCWWVDGPTYSTFAGAWQVPQRPIDVADLHGVTLLGQLPPDTESFGPWTTDHFAQVIRG